MSVMVDWGVGRGVVAHHSGCYLQSRLEKLCSPATVPVLVIMNLTMTADPQPGRCASASLAHLPAHPSLLTLLRSFARAVFPCASQCLFALLVASSPGLEMR